MLSTIQDRARLAGGTDNRWEIMTRLYQEKLSVLIASLDLAARSGSEFELRYFFNGAALYAGDVMCASWSPVGLAFRLPADEVAEMIESGQAIPLKYFAKGHVKKDYALFENPEDKSAASLKRLFERAIEQADTSA